MSLHICAGSSSPSLLENELSIFMFFSLGLEESDKTKLKNFVCQLSSQTNFLWFAIMNLIQVRPEFFY